MNIGRFLVLSIGAHIADVRVGERDDLPGIGRIGKNFLVTRHGGVEYHLSCGQSLCANGSPPKKIPVFQGKQGGSQTQSLSSVYTKTGRPNRPSRDEINSALG